MIVSKDLSRLMAIQENTPRNPNISQNAFHFHLGP